MDNSELIRRRLDEIKSMDNTKEALSALADIQYEIGIGACSERRALQKEIDSLRKVIVGNGDPGSALLTRMKNIENEFSEIGGDVKDIKKSLLGDLHGKEIGMCQRINELEKTSSNLVRVTWVVVTAIIIEVVAVVLGLL